MQITKHWLPFHMGLHTGLKSVMPFNERTRTVVSLRARNAQGEILREEWLNHGEPITGVASLVLDFSGFHDCMKEAGVGMTEATFLSETPYQGAGAHYYFRPGGFTCVLYGPQRSINASGKESRYQGFSVHFAGKGVEACGLVVLNVSTDLRYSRTAHFQYEILDRMGKTVRSGSVDLPPFGTQWIGIDEALGKDGPEMYTIFGRCDGSALISFIYTAMEGGGLGIDHTQPPLSQLGYGEDLTPGFRARYLRWREDLDRRARYSWDRFDDEPVIRLRPSHWIRMLSLRRNS